MFRRRRSTGDPILAEEALADEVRALRPDSDSEPLSALCISGGGIRSATFGLGIIQGLATQGLLSRFDYLSTVSGGGYIGGWLSAWTNRAGGIDQVSAELDGSGPRDGPEPRPVEHLREYNNYLSPKLGLASFDGWTLVATVVRNIILNWMVFVPLLVAAVIVPRLMVAALTFPEGRFPRPFLEDPRPDRDLALDAISRSPWVEWVLPVACCFFFTVALFNMLRFLPGLGNRDHTTYDFIKWVMAPLVLAVLAFMLFDSLFFLGTHYCEPGSPTGSDVAPCVPSRFIYAAMASALAALAGYALAGTKDRFRDRLRPLIKLGTSVLFMAAGTGSAIWLATNYILWNPDPEQDLSWGQYVTVAPPTILLGFALGTVLFVGLSSQYLRDADREWMSRAVAGVLLFCVGWTTFGAIVLLVPTWIMRDDLLTHITAGLLVVMSGGATAFGNSLATDGVGASPRIRRFVSSLVTKLAPPLFLVSLLVSLTLLVDIVLTGPLPGPEVLTLEGAEVPWRDHEAVLDRAHLLGLLVLMGALILLSWVMGRFVRINTFSLHGMYRDRLIRAYLGASNPRRVASRFTGFAPDDDLPMHSLDPGKKPFHVINLTLNLVDSDRLAWQQRKAQSFTVSPLHCGAGTLGYRPSDRYGGPGGISMGTAVALSGAAASPNMGSHSSAAVTFIMTLFNARLGSWLGNPGPGGNRTWTLAGPRSAMVSMLKEALGLTSNRGEYVYLSDGGHFENLGLYEMIRRRCRWIVVIDSGADPDLTFDDLGNALRKIRIDFGVAIEFDDAQFAGVRKGERRCAVATVRYRERYGEGQEDGRLLYIKPMHLGTEPPDVQSYRAANPDFPHQSTAKQFFDESQTESYRALGVTTIHEIAAEWDGETLEDLIEYAGERSSP